MVLRASRDLPGYLRQPLTLNEARRRVVAGLEQRESRFIRQLQTVVYGRARSPYLRLLRYAGCEFGDAEALVRREGVEGALRALAAQGVYVTFDECKGRLDVVRGSARFRFAPGMFDQPGSRPHLLVFTGGSGGRPMRVRRPLGTLDNGASAFALALDAHGLRSPCVVLWIGAYPTWALMNLRLGHEVGAWFYPMHPLHPAARLALPYIAALARLGGRRMPLPQYVALSEPERIVRWLAQHRRPGESLLLNTTASSAVRVATAARSLGVPLTGVTFHCRSEPLTEARRALIEAAGGAAFAEYGTAELCSQAFSCPDAAAPDDLHLFTEQFAMIVHARGGDGSGGPSVRLLQTSLSPHAAKLAINVDFGDTARLEVRDCGCTLGALGLRTHLSEIRSHEKLSTEGVSLARSAVLSLLEVELPARFGGGPLDYQLVEREAADGQTRLVLRIHPNVGPVNEPAVTHAFLSGLGGADFLSASQAHLLRRAASLTIERQPPLATQAGKVLPFQAARHARTE